MFAALEVPKRNRTGAAKSVLPAPLCSFATKDSGTTVEVRYCGAGAGYSGGYRTDSLGRDEVDGWVRSRTSAN